MNCSSGVIQMLSYLRVREFPQGNVTIHFSPQFLLKFSQSSIRSLMSSEMRPFFQSMTGNSFLQERSNVNSDAPYSTSYYKTIKQFTLVLLLNSIDIQDLWVIQMIDVKCWKLQSFSHLIIYSLLKQQIRQTDPLIEQQEHTLLEFWNSYLPGNLHPLIFTDYFRISVLLFHIYDLQATSLDISGPLLQLLEENHFQIQTVYCVPVLVYLNLPVMQVLRHLLCYIERL